MSITFKNEALSKHRQLADSIKATLHREGTQILEKESHGAYNANLPEGFTPESIKVLSKYNGNYLKATTLAVGEFAAAEFKGDKKLQELTAKVGFQAPGDAYVFSIDREREFPIPRGKDEADDAPRRKTTKHLHIERTVELTGTSIKSVTALMSEEFKDRFAS
jgi:hypothetical protein